MNYIKHWWTTFKSNRKLQIATGGILAIILIIWIVLTLNSPIHKMKGNVYDCGINGLDTLFGSTGGLAISRHDHEALISTNDTYKIASQKDFDEYYKDTPSEAYTYHASGKLITFTPAKTNKDTDGKPLKMTIQNIDKSGNIQTQLYDGHDTLGLNLTKANPLK